jgi:putative aldouronate transport system substrate-binding protein
MNRKFWSLISCLLVVFLVLSACAPAAPSAGGDSAQGAQPVATELPPVTISWILDGNGEPAEAALVMERLNNLPQVKALNVNVNLIWYDWGSFDQKTQLMFTSGEECDLIFTSNWANNYINGAVNGNYVALDKLLPVYAPNIWAEVSPVAWTMSKVQGKIYAIPNQQIWYNAWGWQMRKDIADEYGVTLDTINTYDDLTPIMEKILADYPELKYQIIQGSGIFIPGTMGYDQIQGTEFWIKQGDTTRKVVNPKETAEYRKSIELWRSWVQAGFASQEVLDYSAADAARKNGFFPIKLHVEKPGFAAEDKQIYGSDWVGKPLEKPVLGYILPTMTGVCSSSKNPERALMFFDLMYSDAEVFNTVAKGIEGKHWAWVDKDKKVIGFPEGLDPSTSPYNINTDWMIGNNFLAYYLNPDQVGAWEETAKVNKQAVLPMMGPFVFDPTPIQAELAALSTVDQQFGQPLQAGLVDPNDPQKGLAAWLKAQQSAGIEKVQTEIQRQLNEFIEANSDIFK